jgi:hypothetical protein
VRHAKFVVLDDRRQEQEHLHLGQDIAQTHPASCEIREDVRRRAAERRTHSPTEKGIKKSGLKAFPFRRNLLGSNCSGRSHRLGSMWMAYKLDRM